MTKHEFLIEATLNGFVGLGHQTERIGADYIVASAENAWAQLERIRHEDDEGAQLLAGKLEVKS